MLSSPLPALGLFLSVCSCALSCGTCAGAGCSSRPGGADACCGGAIKTSGVKCSDTGAAPCVIDEGMYVCMYTYTYVCTAAVQHSSANLASCCRFRLVWGLPAGPGGPTDGGYVVVTSITIGKVGTAENSVYYFFTAYLLHM